MTGTIAHTASRHRLVALFAAYLALLVWVVLWKLEVPWLGTGTRRTVKLVPFVATPANGPSQPDEVVANVLLFVPFGLYLGLLAPRWSGGSWWKALLVVAGTSAALEAAQYVLDVGRSDMSDVLANTAGGMAGIGLVALTRLVLRARASTVMTAAVNGATLLAVLACALVVASPVRSGGPPPGDGHHLQREDSGTPLSSIPRSARDPG